MSDAPIEDWLDELLQRSRADARTTRRLLDEASDHLYTTAAELRRDGLTGPEAEAEAVRRFGPVPPIARAASGRSVPALALETSRAAVFLAACGLIAVGLSGVVALVMNLWAGRAFVGGQTLFQHSASVAETANDAVSLRVLAGLVGLALLAAHLAWRRRHPAAAVLLPAGLIDALGAAFFAAGGAALAVAVVDQAHRTGSRGVGFALSGAVIALPAALLFGRRAARQLLAA